MEQAPVQGRAMELAVRELPSTPSSIQRYLQDIGFEIELPKAQVHAPRPAHLGPAPRSRAPPPGGTSFYPDDEGSSAMASVSKRPAVTAVATEAKTRLGSESVVAARKGLYLRIPDRTSMDTGIPHSSRSPQVPPPAVEWRGRMLGNKGPLQPQLFMGSQRGTMDSANSITLDTLGVNAALLRVKPPPPTMSVEQFKARLCDAVQAPLPQVPPRSGSSTLAAGSQKHEESAPQAYRQISSKEHSKEHRIDVARSIPSSIHAAKVARSTVGTSGVLKPPPIRPPRRSDPPWRLDPLASPRTHKVTKLHELTKLYEAPATARPLQPEPELHPTSASTASTSRSVITLHMHAPPIHDPITMFPKVHFSENMELEAWKQLPLNFQIAHSQYALLRDREELVSVRSDT